MERHRVVGMRFNNIQLLRVFAAVGVVLFHLGSTSQALIGVEIAWLRFPIIAGFPVPLFFAVSGFVLAQSVQTGSPGRFLFARFLRLYPGYWLAVCATLLLMRLHVYTEHHRWLIYFGTFETATLWPSGSDQARYFLGIEWSLIYEVFLSIAIAAFSLFGARRAVPILMAVWLAAIGSKMILQPGSYFQPFPHWSTIALSAYNVPFLLGALAYQLHGTSRRWSWLVAPGVFGLLVLNSTRSLPAEVNWACWGLAGTGAVWLAATLPQVTDRNPLARLGDCTYGLFLFHAPLLLAVLYPAVRLGWHGRIEAIWVAGLVAIVGGFAFGRVESGLHARLRSLTKRPFPRPRFSWVPHALRRITSS